MKWQNLKQNKCPKDNNPLTATTDGRVVYCSEMECSFKIGADRMTEIVNNTVEADLDDRPMSHHRDEGWG